MPTVQQLQEIRTNGGHRAHWQGDESSAGRRFHSYGSHAILNGEHAGPDMSYVNDAGDEVDGEAIPIKISAAFIRHFFDEDSIGMMFYVSDEDFKKAVAWCEEEEGREMKKEGLGFGRIADEDIELVSEYWVGQEVSADHFWRSPIDVRLTQKYFNGEFSCWSKEGGHKNSVTVMMSVEQVLWFAETCEKMHNWLYTPASKSDDCWVHPDNGGHTALELQAVRNCNAGMMKRLEKIIDRFRCWDSESCERCN